MPVCRECCVLSGRGLCDGLIPCPEETYGCLSVVSVVCCQVEASARADPLSRGILWMPVCRECCVLSGRGLCDGLISCPEQSYVCLSVVIFVFCQVEVSATG